MVNANIRKKSNKINYFIILDINNSVTSLYSILVILKSHNCNEDFYIKKLFSNSKLGIEKVIFKDIELN